MNSSVDRRAVRRAPGRGLVVGFLIVWAALLVGPPIALVRWRDARLEALADPAAQAGWDAFRQDMRQQSGRDGPVQRKVPKSAEPPERVWLRDYLGLAVSAWILFAGVLGGFFGLLLYGTLAAAAPIAEAGRGSGAEQPGLPRGDVRDAGRVSVRE